MQKISQQSKNLVYSSRFGFSKNIVVIAGGPHMDLLGSKLMNTIRSQDHDVKFMGIGGAHMESAGLNGSYADVNNFLNKPLYPYKNFRHFHIERVYHPVFGFYHHANRKVRNEIDKTTFFSDILDVKPDAFICLSNDFFMNRVYNFLTDLYELNNLVRPPVFHYDRTHINQRQEFTDWLDHQFSVNPMKPINWANYTFPSTVVGHEGVGRAWQYLYSRSSEYSSLADEQHIYLSPENNKEIIEQLVAEERVRFRQENGIEESQFALYFAPGDSIKEAKWSCDHFKAGLAEYMNLPENRQIDASHYVVVVSVPQENSGEIADLVNGMKLPVRVLITENKYGAMSGSDCGIAYNGEIVSECAACQLPVSIVENINLAQAYYMQMYNGWNNDLNIYHQGQIQQENITTGFTPYKMAEDLTQMADPKFRYYVADKMADVLYNMVPVQTRNAGKELVQGSKTFIRHGYSYNTMAQKILGAAETYQASEISAPHYKLKELRKNLITQAL